MSRVRSHPSAACGCWPDMSRVRLHPSACGCWPDISGVRVHPSAGGCWDEDDSESLRRRCCRVWLAADQRSVLWATSVHRSSPTRHGHLRWRAGRRLDALLCGGLAWHRPTERCVGDFKPQGLSNTAWAFATAVRRLGIGSQSGVYRGSQTQHGHLRRRAGRMLEVMLRHDFA